MERRAEFEEKAGTYDDLSVLVIDEVSLISATLLHHIDMRLRALLHGEAEFGGLLVICAGDFHQLPPVRGTGIIKSLLDLSGRNVLTGTGKISKAKGARSSLRNPLDAAFKGAQKFATFRLSRLKRSMRSRTDPAFTAHLMAMRDVRNPQPVSAAFLQELERHRPPVVWDGKMQFGVRRNREGDALNAACAARFAEMHNVCLVRWRLPVTGLGQKEFSAEALEVLYKNEPGLWGYFVVGAPALYVNINVSTVCGVVNGADCRMHSLTMRDEYWGRSHTTPADLAARLGQGRGAIVTLSEPPAYVNVEMTKLSPPQADALRPLSAVPGELVVPAGIASKTEDYAFVSAQAATHRLGVTGHVTNHNVALAFALTDYKLQGRTLENLIMVIDPDAEAPSLMSFYVMCSRVTTFAGLFADSGGKSLQHLAKLKHNPDLGIWEGSYIDGRFEIEALKRITLTTARRLSRAHVKKKGQRTAEKSVADRHRAAHPQDPPSTKPKAAEPKPAKAAKPKPGPAKAAPAKAALSSAAPTGPASNMWKENSCHVDAALEVLHAGGFLAQCPCSGRPEQPPASQEAAAQEEAAQMLHVAAHAWMHCRSTAAGPDALDVLRDDVRRCLVRCTLLERALERAPGARIADVEPDLGAHMRARGSASCNVERILASCAAPTHLRVHTVREGVVHGFSGQHVEEPAAFTVSTTVVASVERALAPKATNDPCAHCAQPLSRVRVTSNAEHCLFFQWYGGGTNTSPLPPVLPVKLPPRMVGAEGDVIPYDLVAVTTPCATTRPVTFLWIASMATGGTASTVSIPIVATALPPVCHTASTSASAWRSTAHVLRHGT